MKRTVLTVLIVFMLGGYSAARAVCRVDISRFVGWQIIYSGTVTGYINKKGQRVDDFEGCEYDRVLIVDYSRSVTCAEYSYSYSYMPDIVIMSSGNGLKACIDDEIYDIRR